jgi:hypothetical protein
MALDLIGSWFLPGFGFFRRKQYARAIILFIMIELTFFLGLSLQGSVSLPVLDASGGSIISSLTFIIQLFNGVSGLLSLGAVLWDQSLAAKGLVAGTWIKFFSGSQPHAFFELGAFYLLVSGAMNYFSIMNFYDRYKTGHKGGSSESSEKET